MEAISCKLPMYEGPLDLLLTLISKKKLNIFDIEISVLLEQYMEHISAMREMDLDIASEFLEMASRLVYIKTVSLLPRHEEVEELKRELTGQLLEYRECQEMARKLGERFSFDSLRGVPEDIEFDHTYRRKHDPAELLQAYLTALGKGKRRLPPPQEAFSPIIARTVVSVSSKIMYILRKVWQGTSVRFASLFERAQSKSDLVATFLAVLELVKAKRLYIEENGEDEVSVKLIGEGRTKKWKSKSMKLS